MYHSRDTSGTLQYLFPFHFTWSPTGLLGSSPDTCDKAHASTPNMERALFQMPFSCDTYHQLAEALDIFSVEILNIVETLIK